MAKYSKKAGSSAKNAMHKAKRDKSGKTVTSRKQAIEIGVSEACKK